MHLCLFCVEKKGWSDSFASQAQYNKHYGESHEGRIPAAAAGPAAGAAADKRKWNAERAAALARGEEPPKRPPTKQARQPICRLCARTFPHAPDLNRHLIAAHGYDYCKVCNLVGVPAAVRFHLLEDEHAQDKNVCHLCLGSSPVFESAAKLRAHLTSCHGVEKKAPRYPCLDGACAETDASFASLPEYKEHLLHQHLTKADVLRPMKRKYKRNVESEQPLSDTEETASTPLEEFSEFPALKKVAGISNEGGQDCFAIAALHLLAQTELPERLGSIVRGHEECAHPRCLLGKKQQKISIELRP